MRGGCLDKVSYGNAIDDTRGSNTNTRMNGPSRKPLDTIMSQLRHIPVLRSRCVRSNIITSMSTFATGQLSVERRAHTGYEYVLSICDLQRVTPTLLWSTNYLQYLCLVVSIICYLAPTPCGQCAWGGRTPMLGMDSTNSLL